MLCQADAGDALAVVAQDFGNGAVPGDLDLGIVLGPLGHDFRRPQLVAAVDQVDDAGELAEVVGLFDGRIAAADHRQRPIAEPRQCAVADRAAADAAVLELLFRGQAEVVGPAPVATITARAS